MVQLPKKLDVDGARLGTGCDNPEIMGFMSQQILDRKLWNLLRHLFHKHLRMLILAVMCFLTRPWFLLSFPLQWQVHEWKITFDQSTHTATTINLSRPLEWTYGCIVDQTTITWELILLIWNLEITSMLPERNLRWVAAQLNPVVVDVITAKLVSI